MSICYVLCSVSRHITLTFSFNLHKNLKVGTTIPLHRNSKWDSEMLSHLLKWLRQSLACTLSLFSLPYILLDSLITSKHVLNFLHEYRAYRHGRKGSTQKTCFLMDLGFNIALSPQRHSWQHWYSVHVLFTYFAW